MAEIYKKLGAVDVSANTDTVLYTVPGGKSAVTCGMNVCNKNNSQIVFRVAHISGGLESLSDTDYIYYDLAIDPYDTYEITRSFTLSTGDTLMVRSDTSSVNFIVWGSEVG